MNSVTSIKDSTSGNAPGRIAPPQGEEVGGHAPGNPGGKKAAPALAEPVPSGAPSLQSEAAAADVESLMAVTRATCKIRVDLAELCPDKESREAHIRRRCPESCPACEVERVLWATQKDIALVRNVVTRALWRLDGDLLDRFLIEHQRPPKGSEWRLSAAATDPLRIVACVSPGTPAAGSDAVTKLVHEKGYGYTYPLARLVAPNLPSAITVAAYKSAEEKWRGERFDVLVRQIRSPAHYKQSGPIEWHVAGGIRFAHVEGKRYRIRVMLPGGWREFPVTAYDGYLAVILKHLAAGTWKLGQPKMMPDERRRGVWYFRVPYKKMVQSVAQDARVCGITLGIRRAVCAIGFDGDTWSYDGQDIEAHLRQVEGQRRSRQRSWRGTNRHGRGIKAALEPTEILQRKVYQWRDTKILTIARRVAEWVEKRGYTLVHLADFTAVRSGLPEHVGGKGVWDRIQTWPVFQLRSAIVSALQDLGIATTEVDPRRASECPECTGPLVLDLKRRLCRCEQCRFRGDLDLARARRILKRGEELRQGEAASADAASGASKPTKPTARKAGRRASKAKPDAATPGDGKGER